MNSAIIFVSLLPMPLVVIAGIPIRRPEGRNGGSGSSGMVDLDVDIQIFSRAFSA
jgi:hypothetical protein